MIEIQSNNQISIDGKPTGFYVTQRATGTVVYSAGAGGVDYKEHAMPHARYSLAHDKPASGAAGRAQFETDIRSLLDQL